MSDRLLLLGGGGHCKSVIDSLLQSDRYADIGIVEKRENGYESIQGIPVIGCDDDLPKLYKQGFTHAFVTVGNLPNPKTRIKLQEKLTQIGFNIPIIIDSSAVVALDVNLGEGVFIGKNAVINSGVSIGKGAIINTSVIVEHDCNIAEFVHLAPGVILCGTVRVGQNTHIGAGSVVKEQLNIGSNSLIGMGSIVLKSIRNNVLAYGNPCEEVKEL